LTSDRKIKANRDNARASTGPKTQHGRARSTRNALRHGLSLPVVVDPALADEVAALARAIAGPDANADQQRLARQVAEAEVDLRRVLQARHHLLSNTGGDPGHQHQADTPGQGRGPADLIRLLRKAAANTASAAAESTVPKPAAPAPDPHEQLALALTHSAKRMHAFDRYERRARSRRKFAIRALDQARQRRSDCDK
jgi:hypothetical protein